MSTVIVALPEQRDATWKYSSEKKPHMTLLYLGETTAEEDKVILELVQNVAENVLRPFHLDVDRRGPLGPEDADVLFFKQKWDYKPIKEARNAFLRNDTIMKLYVAAEQFDGWVPHLTMGYPDAPAKPTPEYEDFYGVSFDRIAVWFDEYDGPDFQLSDRTPPEVAEWNMPTAAHSAVNALLEHAGLDLSHSELCSVENCDQHISHFGTKGMRWGVRRDERQLSRHDQGLNLSQRTQVKIASTISTLASVGIASNAAATAFQLQARWEHIKALDAAYEATKDNPFIRDAVKETAAQARSNMVKALLSSAIAASAISITVGIVTKRTATAYFAPLHKTYGVARSAIKSDIKAFHKEIEKGQHPSLTSKQYESKISDIVKSQMTKDRNNLLQPFAELARSQLGTEYNTKALDIKFEKLPNTDLYQKMTVTTPNGLKLVKAIRTIEHADFEDTGLDMPDLDLYFDYSFDADGFVVDFTCPTLEVAETLLNGTYNVDEAISKYDRSAMMTHSNDDSEGGQTMSEINTELVDAFLAHKIEGGNGPTISTAAAKKAFNEALVKRDNNGKFAKKAANARNAELDVLDEQWKKDLFHDPASFGPEFFTKTFSKPGESSDQAASRLESEFKKDPEGTMTRMCDSFNEAIKKNPHAVSPSGTMRLVVQPKLNGSNSTLYPKFVPNRIRHADTTSPEGVELTFEDILKMIREGKLSHYEDVTNFLMHVLEGGGGLRVPTASDQTRGATREFVESMVKRDANGKFSKIAADRNAQAKDLAWLQSGKGHEAVMKKLKEDGVLDSMKSGTELSTSTILGFYNGAAEEVAVAPSGTQVLKYTWNNKTGSLDKGLVPYNGPSLAKLHFPSKPSNVDRAVSTAKSAAKKASGFVSDLFQSDDDGANFMESSDSILYHSDLNLPVGTTFSHIEINEHGGVIAHYNVDGVGWGARRQLGTLDKFEIKARLSLDEFEAYLAHIGVKGMRWGVRRKRGSDGLRDGMAAENEDGSFALSGKTFHKAAPGDVITVVENGKAKNLRKRDDGNWEETRLSVDAESFIRTHQKAGHEMSTREMKEAIQRADLAKKYDDIFGPNPNAEILSKLEAIKTQKEINQIEAELNPTKIDRVKNFMASANGAFQSFQSIDKVCGGALSREMAAAYNSSKANRSEDAAYRMNKAFDKANTPDGPSASERAASRFDSRQGKRRSGGFGLRIKPDRPPTENNSFKIRRPNMDNPAENPFHRINVHEQDKQALREKGLVPRGE